MKFIISINDDEKTKEDKPYKISYAISKTKAMTRIVNGGVTLHEIIHVYKRDKFEQEAKEELGL